MKLTYTFYFYIVVAHSLRRSFSLTCFKLLIFRHLFGLETVGSFDRLRCFC